MRRFLFLRYRLLAPVVVLALLLPGRLAGQGAASGEPEKGQVYIIPFSHLDLFWAGTREECLSRGDRIIAKAIQLGRKYPQARYLIEDEVWLANYVDAHRGSPEVEELKRLVKAGAIEVGSKWAGIYQNLPRGESQVRNHLYGKRYAREVFGVDPQVSHLGDLPGYTWQYPQILNQAGVPYVVMTRMGPPDHSLFHWKSPDGSVATVWHSIKGYGWGVRLGLHRDLNKERLDRIGQEVKEIQATVNGPIYLGWGTDLFAPSEQVVENIPLLNKSLAPLHFQLATPSEYFRAAAKVQIPELSGEIPSSWANLLTSLFQLWPPAQTGTDTLLSAEKFAAINYALGYADYPQQEFELLWKHLLESMDHNNFGQGGDIGDARKMNYANTARLRGGDILRDMLRNLAERVRQPFPASTAIVVFNPMSWTRDDVVDTHLSVYGDVGPGDRLDLYRKGMRLVDANGSPVPFHVRQSGGTVSVGMDISFVARGVPSLGYKTYYLVPADGFDAFPGATTVTADDPDPARPKRTLDQDRFENRFYIVSVDRATGGITVWDKELGRNIVKDAAVAGTEERGGNSIAIEPYTGRDQLFSPLSVEIEENNPIRTVVRIPGVLAGIPVTERMFLYAGLKKIDLETTVQWPQNKFLRLEQRFPYEQQGVRIRYGIPYASAGDGEVMPGTGPRQRDEVPAAEWRTWRQIQDWMFAGNRESGFTLSADRQLIILSPGVVRVGMLRGTYSTQEVQRGGRTHLIQVPYAGTYTFRYSLASGKGDWAAARSYRTGSDFANPLIPVTSVDELSPKELPPTHSFLSLGSDNLVVGALKKAEQDGSIILRLCEAAGEDASAAVEFLGAKSAFQTVNLLEENTGPAGQNALRMKPYEIRTVRIKAR